jgi:hypothetical protein
LIFVDSKALKWAHSRLYATISAPSTTRKNVISFFQIVFKTDLEHPCITTFGLNNQVGWTSLFVYEL